MVVQDGISCQNISTEKEVEPQLLCSVEVIRFFFCFTLVGFLHLFLIILKLLMQIKDKIRKTRREEHYTEENMPMSSKEIKRFEDAE